MKTKLILLGLLISSITFGQTINIGGIRATSSNAITKEDTTGSNPEMRSAHDMDSIIVGFSSKITEEYVRSLINADSLGTIYYVSNNGSDANTGLTPKTAFAHHPWMSTWTGSVVLVPGDIVCMERGGTWTIASPAADYMTVAQSGTNGKPIITTAYGAGVKPLIKISTATAYPVINVYGESFLRFDNLHIQHNSSTYNSNSLYAGIRLVTETASVPHDIIITNCEMDNIPHSCVWGAENSYRITIGDTLATETATVTKYNNHFHDYGYAGVYLLGCNPSDDRSDFKVYYNYIHDATQVASGADEYGVAVGALANSHNWPSYVYVRFNYITDIKTHEGIDTHGGTHIYFQDNYVNNFGTAGIYATAAEAVNGFVDTLNYLYIERNIIEQPVSGWVAGSEYAFIQQGASEIARNVFIRNNIIRYTERPAANLFSGIRIISVDTAEISGNHIYNGRTGAGAAPAIYLYSGGTGGKNIKIDDNFIHDWGAPCIRIPGDDITDTISLTNNILCTGASNALYISDADISATGRLTLYNNTLLTTGNEPIYFTAGTASGSVLTAKNNIVALTATSNQYYLQMDDTTDGDVFFDNNLYWNSGYSGTTPFYIKGNISWANWKDAKSYDTTSVNTSGSMSPAFKNANGDFSEETDFELQNTSPAIDGGVDVGLDYYGFRPDIGSKESISTTNSFMKFTPSADPPNGAVEGWIYMDTDHHLYIHNGTTWIQLDN